MYNKILVPHAGTKAGNKALDHAAHLAKKTQFKNNYTACDGKNTNSGIYYF